MSALWLQVDSILASQHDKLNKEIQKFMSQVFCSIKGYIIAAFINRSGIEISACTGILKIVENVRVGAFQIKQLFQWNAVH